MNKIFDNIPLLTMGNGSSERWNRLADLAARPAQNRAIMGVSALMFQPLIDKYNYRVNKETRDVSWKCSIARIIVGTGTGILVRQPVFDVVKAMTSPEKNKKYSKWLIPKSKRIGLKENSLFLKNYRIAVATLSALAIMGAGTNFLLDVPATIFLTNKLIGSPEKNKQLNEEGIDVKV